nr:transposase [Streptomyces sp. RLB1-33]
MNVWSASASHREEPTQGGELCQRLPGGPCWAPPPARPRRQRFSPRQGRRRQPPPWTTRAKAPGRPRTGRPIHPWPSPPKYLIVTPGPRADCTQFKPVLEKIRVPKPGPVRPRNEPDGVAADNAYGNRPCREYLRRRDIRHTIPEKTDSQAARLRKGSRGGRPPGFVEERDKKRNTVERIINPAEAAPGRGHSL